MQKELEITAPKGNLIKEDEQITGQGIPGRIVRISYTPVG